ncbi:MAG: hypothetical protein QXU82_01060 [Candidatus Aenigmatarchaeota archaeon]
MAKLSLAGFSFGITSGIITTLGLLVGVYEGTHSELAVIGAVLTIAVADAFSDSLGMHVSTESRVLKKVEIWRSTYSTFVAKFLIALTFAVPIFFMRLQDAVVADVAWGMSLLALLSYYIGRRQHEKPLHVVAEHLSIGAIVIVATYFLGIWIAGAFGSIA